MTAYEIADSIAKAELMHLSHEHYMIAAGPARDAAYGVLAGPADADFESRRDDAIEAARKAIAAAIA